MRSLAPFFALSLFAPACAPAPAPKLPPPAAPAPASPGLSSADAATLMRLDTEFSRMSEQRGAADAFAEYLAEDAVELENNGDVVRGRSAIAETLRTPSTIRLVLKWKPEAAEASGDLGYTWGRYTLDVTTPEGPSPTRYGKYVTVWRRQRDNVWKVVLDAGNSTPSRAQKP